MVGAPVGEASPSAKGLWPRRLVREPDGRRLGSLMGSSRIEEKGLEGWKELVEVREGAALWEAIVLGSDEQGLRVENEEDMFL